MDYLQMLLNFCQALLIFTLFVASEPLQLTIVFL